MTNKEIIKFVQSQKSLHLYKHIQEAFVDVLSKLSMEQFELVKNNLIIMAFHDGVVGQVMHFNPKNSKFAVMQLYIPKDMPDDVLREVIAHELGHFMQNRNWKEADGMSLEEDADEFARRIGFPKTDKINEWLTTHSS